MREIPLTQGKVALVDDEDFEWLSQWKWQAVKDRYTFYAQRRGAEPERKTIRMHRIVLNAPDGIEVDHADGNGLRNTRDNLRLATQAQNAANRRMRIDNTSGYRGVSWLPGKRRWIAMLRVNGRHVLSRSFRDKTDAALAYDEAATAALGEFARLNFPDCSRDYGSIPQPKLLKSRSGLFACGHAFSTENTVHFTRYGRPRTMCRLCRNSRARTGQKARRLAAHRAEFGQGGER